MQAFFQTLYGMPTELYGAENSFVQHVEWCLCKQVVPQEVSSATVKGDALVLATAMPNLFSKLRSCPSLAAVNCDEQVFHRLCHL